MKILLIEDQESDIQGIIDYCEEKEYLYEHKKFDEGISYIEQYDPDILILDLKNNVSNDFDGCDALDKAWEYHFRPTCVFSGQITDSTVDIEKYRSPLVAFIDKGDENPVKEFIDKVEPYVNCIREVRNETNVAMRKSFDFFDLAIKDEITDPYVISALCSNRMKSYFDNEMAQKDFPIWSQYIYPTVNEDFSTGDVIAVKNCDCNTAIQKKFFVILSQSCDIAHGKIKDVLVAKCYDIKLFLRKRRLEEGQYELRSKEEVKTILNTGFCNEFFPLPGIDSVIPDTVINLKELKLIPLTQLSSNYQKIASLSSPYKERLIWAYMQTACRPGVPDLDIEKWCDYLFQPEDDGEIITEERIEQTQIAKDEVKVVCTA